MERRIVALITGKKNSTFIDKNIVPIKGIPLVAYPAITAKKSKYITDFFVSSDDDRILDICSKIGYRKIKRPEELCQPDSLHIDVIRHALDEIVFKDIEILVVLMANSGTVKTEWIDDCIEKIFYDSSISSVVPVTQEQCRHPYRAKTLDNKGNLISFFNFGDKVISTNRQDLSPCYFLCHNFWVLNLKQIDFINGQQPWTFLGNKIKPYSVDSSFDVHGIEDIDKLETWLFFNKININAKDYNL
jgi:CMP-N,N'-diacetyllegionaminic acid synthase